MIQKLTDINLEAEALQASKCRNVETSLKEQAYISTRDARAHEQLAGMKPGRQRTIASRGGIAVVSTANLTRNPRCEVVVVSRDNTLAEFHRDWIREEIAHAEK